MAGKDTKAALLLALAPKEGDESTEKSAETESGGDPTGEDILAAISDKDPDALKSAIRRLVLSCMTEEESD